MNTRRTPLLRSFGALALLGAVLAGCGDDPEATADNGDQADQADHWTYADIAAWGDTCESGLEQSPIDLTGAVEADLADLGLDYVPADATVVDTGHSIQATLDGAGTMTRDDTIYTLRQFHMHTPSEHHLDGAALPAELHLVHEAEDGSLGVLGVLVEEGAASPTIAELLDVLPAEGTEMAGAVSALDVSTLLPEDLRTFRYDGSLTTPPCSEGVAWSVLAEPVTWSAEQITAFAERHPDSARPPLPLGERELLLDNG